MSTVPATPSATGWPLTPPALTPPALARYLAFLGVDAPGPPSLTTLEVLQLVHTRAIPFENFDAIHGREIPLELGALTSKLLSGRRGGYCFEHNVLLAAALVALGYDVTLLAGRVLVGADGPRPRTHLALQVTLDGRRWLVDAGFGRTTLNGPLAIDDPGVQLLAGDPYRLTDVGGELLLQASRGSGRVWTDLYVLDRTPVLMADVEMANYFVATHPSSHLRQAPIVLRPTALGKRSLAGTRLVIDEGERQIDRQLAPAELDGILRQEFGIELPAGYSDR